MELLQQHYCVRTHGQQFPDGGRGRILPQGSGYRRITGSTRTSLRMSASVVKADLVRVRRHVAKVPILLQKFVEVYDER
jgi:hypothetical protein